MTQETLTQEQLDKLPFYYEKWLKVGYLTKVDKARAEAAMDAIYRASELVPPEKKIWLRSPKEGVLKAVELVGGETTVSDQLRECGFGSHDVGWLSYYNYLLEVCSIEECNFLKPWMDLAESGCGWYWPLDDAVIMTEPPIKISLDDQKRLHCEDGPALLYSDGLAHYSWHGVTVPDWVVEDKPQITPQKILEESNQEVKRIMLEIYTWNKFLDDLGAVMIHQDTFGILFETDKLGQYLAGEDPTARFVRVTDPSTGRVYALRVPPETKTAQEAVAWTFNTAPEAYSPVAEA